MDEIAYDVFISHAYEDQNPFANELAIALKKKGLRVWYSGLDLKLGDSIAASVNDALKSARYGVVIISPVYLQKPWAMRELKALFAQEEERNRILPVLHDISMKQIQKELPVLADRYAISSKKSLTTIINKILQVIKGKRKYTRREPPKTKGKKTRKKTPKANVISKAGLITLGGAMTIHAGQVAGGDIHNHDKK